MLRLPVTPVRSLICFASGVHATLLGSCLAACACAPGRSEGAFRAGVIVQPATRLPACSHVDVSGISQVSRRSILCLCLGPGPRPNQRSLAYLSVSSMLPPLRGQRRLQRVSYFGAIARLQHLLPTLQEWCCHHPCKARFRLAGLPLPGGSRTLWITTKGFRSHSRPPLLDLSWRNVRRVFPQYGWKAGFQTVPSWVISGLSLLPAFAVRHPVCIRSSCTSWSPRWSALSRA